MSTILEDNENKSGNDYSNYLDSFVASLCKNSLLFVLISKYVLPLSLFTLHESRSKIKR
jgi:hypothetical protein